MAWWTATMTLKDTWLLAAPFMLIAGTAAVIGVGRRRLTFRRVFYASFPFVFSVAIILIGVVFNNPTSQRSATPSFAPELLLILVATQFCVSAFLVWRFGGTRIFTVSMSLAALVVSLVGAFISIMSVTGVWL